MVERHRRHIRASDADREHVAERLRKAADEGRLFVDEFDERLGQALSARTYGELDAIIADLPAKRDLVTRSGRATSVLRHRNQARLARRAGMVLRCPRPGVLIAGALATVAVAVPLTVTEVGTSGPSASARQAPGVFPCTNHWTKTSVVLPCDWGKIASQADAPQIANDVIKANNHAQ